MPEGRLFPECSAEGFLFKGWGPGVQEATRGRCVCGRKRAEALAERRTCVGLASDLRRTCVGLASDLRRTCRRRKSSRNAELSSLFTFRITKLSTVTGIGGVMVAKPRTVVTFGLTSGERKGEERREEENG